jgi:hypothetical protein
MEEPFSVNTSYGRFLRKCRTNMSYPESWGERANNCRAGRVRLATEHEPCGSKTLIVLRAIFVVVGLPIAWAMLTPHVPLPTLQATLVVIGGTLMYVALGYLIDPFPDMDNLDPTIGMVDRPWTFSDNRDRRFLWIKCLLGPGRFIAESVFDVHELFATGEETEEGADEEGGTPPDLIALALRTDSTRIVSFMYTNAGSNRSYPEVDVREGHHTLSHHGNDKDKQAQISKINRYHATFLAGLLDRLKSYREGDASVLDRSLIVYGSGIGDGNRHNHDELPILLAGQGAGAVRSGRHLRYPKDTPLTNLYLTMLHNVGARLDSFSDSTGELEGLA